MAGLENLDAQWEAAYSDYRSQRGLLEHTADWQANAQNPITRIIASFAVRHRERVLFDSEQELQLIEECQALEAGRTPMSD